MCSEEEASRKKCSSLVTERFILALVMGKLPEEFRVGDILQNRPNSFKDVNVIKKGKGKKERTEKERRGSCSELNKTEKTGQLNERHRLQ